MTDSIEKRALTWASGDDTGVSSKAILKVMTGQTISDDYCHPHDSQDLGRCVRLLDIIPEWRPRIGEMSNVSDEWAALSAVWPELEALHRAESHNTVYSRIKAIVRPIEDARGNVIRMGDEASVIFGKRRR
jgi:hypothetical protein